MLKVSSLCYRFLPGLLVLATVVGNNVSLRTQGDGPLILDDPQISYPLELHLEYMEDPSGDLTIDDVTQPEFATRFVPNREKNTNFGLTHSTYWLRLHVSNETSQADFWRLAFTDARQGMIDLYYRQQGETVWNHQQAGRYLPSTVREYLHPNFIFPLEIPASTDEVIYLRLQSNLPIRFSLILWPAKLFTQTQQVYFLKLGMIYGTVIAIAIYNLTIFLFLKRPGYLYYFVFVLLVALNLACIDGVTYVYLFPEWSHKFTVLITTALVPVVAIPYVRSFLEVKSRIPWVDRALIILAILSGLSLLPFLFDIHSLEKLAFHGLAFIPVVVAFLVITATLMIWRQGFSAARYFLFGWLIPLLYFIYYFFSILGIASSTPSYDWVFYLSVLLMVIFLSSALADQVHTLTAQARQSEFAFQDSNERFRATFEQAAVGIAHVDLQGRFFRINQKFCEIVGYNWDELRKLSFKAITHPDDLDANLEGFKSLQSGQEIVYSTEKRYIKKAGETVWVKLTASSITSMSNEPEYFVTVIQDISERKAIQQALIESEQKYRNLVEIANDGIVVLQEEYIVFVNSRMGEIAGFNVDELFGTSFTEYIAEEEKPKVMDIYRRRIKGEDVPRTYESVILRKDHSPLDVEFNVSKIIYDGNSCLMVVVRDITKRKQAVDALRERKERYQLALQSGSIALWQVDLATWHWDLDGAVEQITGYTIEELGSEYPLEGIIYPKDREWIDEYWKKMVKESQELYSVVNRILHKNGSIRWIKSLGSTVLDENGQVIRVLGTTRDITETRQAEDLLVKSQAIGHVGSWELDFTGNMLFWSDEVFRIYGLESDTFVPYYDAFLQLVHPEDRSMVAEAYLGSIDEDEKTHEIMHRLIRPDSGEVRWVLEKYDHIRDLSGNLIRCVGMVQDITENKLNAEALYQSREQMAILNRSSEIINMAGLDSERVFTAIRAACAWLGPADVVAISLVDKTGGEVEDVFLMDRDRRLPGKRYALNGSVVEEILQDGISLWISDFNDEIKWPGYQSGVRSGMAIVLCGGQECQGVLFLQSYTPNAYTETDLSILESFAAYISVTLENIRYHKQIEKTAVLEERQRLSSELHDSVTQLLYSICLMSNGWGYKASRNQLPDPADYFYQIEELSMQALKEMRMLIYQLQPPVLAEVGLIKALEDRLDKVERRMKIEAQLHLEGRLPKLSELLEEEIYFIILEALNNSLRHARASSVDINIQRKSKQLHISVCDNGRGYDLTKPSKGLGTAILNHRATVIGARLTRDSQPGQGTRIELEVEL